jgi:hypothetical protein
MFINSSKNIYLRTLSFFYQLASDLRYNLKLQESFHISTFFLSNMEFCAINKTCQNLPLNTFATKYMHDERVTLKSITLILMREKHLGLVIYQVAHGL